MIICWVRDKREKCLFLSLLIVGCHLLPNNMYKITCRCTPPFPPDTLMACMVTFFNEVDYYSLIFEATLFLHFFFYWVTAVTSLPTDYYFWFWNFLGTGGGVYWFKTKKEKMLTSLVNHISHIFSFFFFPSDPCYSHCDWQSSLPGWELKGGGININGGGKS